MTFSKLQSYKKENLKKCTTFEEQKCRRYIRGNVYFGIIVFSCLSSTKPCLRFLLICFYWEIKGFYQSSIGNEVDFTDMMDVSPNILAKNKNFKKLRHYFVDKRAMITTALTSSCHQKTLPSQHAIFREYSLRVPSVSQCLLSVPPVSQCLLSIPPVSQCLLSVPPVSQCLLSVLPVSQCLGHQGNI